MSLGEENTDSWGVTYSAPEVSEQTLDSGGNYVTEAESRENDPEPMGYSQVD
jgi:hypothetical protein